MARRPLEEINAGSMADIAFLLLIFWLVTTTIDSDVGIKRQLPPPVPPNADVPQAREQNVFNVKVNFLNQLLVEGEPLDLEQLKNKAKSFLIATGDGIMSHPVGGITVGPEREVVQVRSASGSMNAAFPERVWVREAEVKAKVREYEAAVQAAGGAGSDKAKPYEGALELWREKLTTIELLGGDYKELPGSALISMQNDNNTTYDTYIQVQNELQTAVNELRDEVALAKFGETFTALEDRYDRNPDDDELLKKIVAVRTLYPQRISEAEPRQATGY